MPRMIDAVDKANKILRQFDLRNPERIARQADIMVLPQPFKKQKGAYTVIERQPIIFIKEDLPSVTRQIVIGHELGHVYHFNEKQREQLNTLLSSDFNELWEALVE